MDNVARKTGKRKGKDQREYELEKELLEKENAGLKEELEKLGLFSDSSFLPLQPDSEQEKTYSTEAVAPSSTLTSVSSSSTSYAELPDHRKGSKAIQIGRTNPAVQNAKRVIMKADLYETMELKGGEGQNGQDETVVASISEGTLIGEQMSDAVSTTPQRFYEAGRQVEIGRFPQRRSTTTVGQSTRPESVVTGSTVSKRLNFDSSETEEEPAQALPKCVGSIASTENKWELRIIGEIAFQLDRRILQHVFCHRRRLYGFTVRNIEEKINEIATDACGVYDQVKVKDLKHRKEDLMSLLSRQAEFDPNYHPMFSELLVNKFGILKINPSDTKKGLKPLMDIDYLAKVVMDNVEVGYRKDAMILLRSLNALSAWDKKPIFMW